MLFIRHQNGLLLPTVNISTSILFINICVLSKKLELFSPALLFSFRVFVKITFKCPFVDILAFVFFFFFFFESVPQNSHHLYMITQFQNHFNIFRYLLQQHLTSWCQYLSYSAWVAIIKHHRMPGLNNSKTFFTVLRTKSLKQKSYVLVRTSLLCYRLPLSHCVLIRQTEQDLVSLSYKDTHSILMTSSEPNPERSTSRLHIVTVLI